MRPAGAGSYSFDDVPLSNYGVAVKIDGKWHATMGGHCAGRKPGETCDLGIMKVRKSP